MFQAEGLAETAARVHSVWRDPDSSVLLRCSDSPSTGEGQSDASATLCLTPIQSGSSALPDAELQRLESQGEGGKSWVAEMSTSLCPISIF